jgi:BlaI family penicillinase repressor
MSPPRLGKVQLQIMRLLWRDGEATARRITDELSRTQPIAHSTVQTLLRKMEAKGAVSHDVFDRTFVFRPLYHETEVTETAVTDLLTRLFDGSVYGLVANLLRSRDVSPEELARLRTLIDEEERSEEERS